MSQGIVYIALGNEYLTCAINSAASARAVGTICPISIIVNSDEAVSTVSAAGFIPLKVNITTEDNRLVKTALIDYSPYDNTMYIDADTIHRVAVDWAFDYLKSFSICCCLAEINEDLSRAGHITKEEIKYTQKICQIKHPTQFNGGMVLFRKDEVSKRFFEAWLREWQVFKRRDQAAMVRAFYTTGIAPYILTKKHWHSIRSDSGYIIHSMGRSIAGIKKPKKKKKKK